KVGLSYTRKRFETIAQATIKELAAEIAAGIRPITNNDYVRVINKYFIPFFGKRYLENISAEHFREYEVWRNTLMKRVPLASTLATHASDYNRIIGTAVHPSSTPKRIFYSFAVFDVNKIKHLA
ncbi:MAG: hypothetical protein ACOYMH_14675, partial [Zwartia sp.]